MNMDTTDAQNNDVSNSIDAKIEKLDHAQTELEDALGCARDMLEYLSTTGVLATAGEDSGKLNLARLGGFGSDFLGHLSKVQRVISEEIQHLTHFVPMESTSYGTNLEVSIEKQRLDFMSNYLEETKALISSASNNNDDHAE